MDSHCKFLDYEQTGYFSKLIVDYLKQHPNLQQFYNHPPTLKGIQKTIEERKAFPTTRALLVDELTKQYSSLTLTTLQQSNLQSLLDENTFTVCTAHQPNIFTGHLYFIYKILHTVKLANYLMESIPGKNFVPVYYMGSEDADLEELGHIFLNGEKIEWQTKQTGAVGRMKVDKNFIQLIERIAGELTVQPYGQELISLFKEAYQLGATIQDATLKLVHELFKDFGLLILIPDNANLKRAFNPVVSRELLEQFSHPLVEETGKQLQEHYKMQASGREINLFYLQDGSRERIEKIDNNYVSGQKQWSEPQILAELEQHPENFSANVILRGIFQETILPNIVFIGGGGEVAYWLELKKVFEACNVPFPVLVLRNSFLLVNEKQLELAAKLRLQTEDLFKSERDLLKYIVNRENSTQLNLDQELEQMHLFYSHLQTVASNIDPTLNHHVVSLQSKEVKRLKELEKKMLRAETKKFEAERRQLHKLKVQLFPQNSLQERTENFSSFYALYGKEWMNKIYEASTALEQQFGIIEFK
ncbi:MAG: bshC [Segetibacter sp.]|nr:bshC [Segetibacter sp.]